MSRQRIQPDLGHLSVFTATLALALLMARLVRLPFSWEVTLTLPGLVVPIRLTTAGVVAVFIAALSVGGIVGMLQRATDAPPTLLLPHAVLPAVSAWGLEALLQRLPLGPMWLVAFGAGMGFVLLVILAEFAVAFPGDERYPWAAAAVNGLGFVALLLITYSLHGAAWRLVYALPVLGSATALVSLRALYLKLPDRWRPVEATLIAVTTLHPAAAWRYLPLPSASYALMVLGVAYAATLFTANWLEGQTLREALVEPLVSLGLIVLVWLWSW